MEEKERKKNAKKGNNTQNLCMCMMANHNPLLGKKLKQIPSLEGILPPVV